MTAEQPAWDEPCFVISIAARMVGVNVQTLRYYERTGMLSPSRTRGNIRLYSPYEIGRLRRIKTLISDLGVNLAGAEVILRLTDRLQEMEGVVEALGAEVERLREQIDEQSGPARSVPPRERSI